MLIVHGVMYSTRVFVSPSLRKEVSAYYQGANNGVSGMILRTQKSVLWPGKTNDIDKVRKDCRSCSEYAPSQQMMPAAVADVPESAF